MNVVGRVSYLKGFAVRMVYLSCGDLVFLELFVALKVSVVPDEGASSGIIVSDVGCYDEFWIVAELDDNNHYEGFNGQGRSPDRSEYDSEWGGSRTRPRCGSLRPAERALPLRGWRAEPQQVSRRRW